MAHKKKLRMSCFFLKVPVGFYFMFLLLAVPEYSFSQRQDRSGRLAGEASAAFRSGDMAKAMSLAQRGMPRDSSDLRLILLMAEIHREMKNSPGELACLRKASELPGVPFLIHYRLGEAFFKAGNYEDSFKALNHYLGGDPAPGLAEKAAQLLLSASFAREAILKPSRFSLENLGDAINSEFDEYWPSLTVDGATLVFTRLVPDEFRSSLLQEDFFASYLDTAGWTDAVPVTGINTPLNEGAQTISADGRLLFFTRCNHPDGHGSCDIWFSRLEEGNWSLPRNAGRPLNSAAWEGQPSLSAFGDILYFASNRPGGKGNKDIWSIGLKGWRPDGMPLWGEPVNLGDSINTSGEEISPFIHPNGRDLYFSSDYWPGFGGLDMFRSYRKPDGSWTKAENLGYPVNTSGNEQGMIIDRTGTRAYMASGRETGRGMDIYSFGLDENLRPEPVSYIRGIVSDRKSGKPVPATILLTGIDSVSPMEVKIRTGRDGGYTVTLPASGQYAFHVEEPGYLFYSESFRADALEHYPEPIIRNIELIPVEVGSLTHLHNVFFDTGSSVILDNSEPELRKLLEFLRQNHQLRVEIQGHTDNRGSEALNMELSENRAKSVVDYLTERGIDPGRMTHKGYGYSMPVDTNESEQGRARNRRTTILITGVLRPLQE